MVDEDKDVRAIDVELKNYIDMVRSMAYENLEDGFNNFVIALANACKYKDEQIRELEKFVEDVRGVIAFGYETMEDMIKDLEIYLRELEK